MLTCYRHPCLLLPLGACVDPSQPFCLVLPLMAGGSLHARLHEAVPGQAPLRALQRLTAVASAASALAYLHGQRPDPVVHRDVKVRAGGPSFWRTFTANGRTPWCTGT